ncbi:MAG TPA: STAS domain-containing protein [Chondromyces sp.]|nr:STAS domain-containing protein [Chondromyces sp.]
MKFNIDEVVNKIAELKYDWAEKITEAQNKKYPEQLLPISSILKEERVKLISLYEELLYDDLDVAINKIKRWGEETGTFCSEQGMSVDAALDELHYYRADFEKILIEEAEKQGTSIRAYQDISLKLHRIIDQAAQSFSVAFVRHHKEMMEKAESAVQELSVPVVPLEKGVAVLPLIGMIDTYRAKLLMEESLSRSSKLGISYFIMDLSGVPVVDTMVANQIFQVIHALRLLGIHAVLSGIRPEIAQTMIGLGLDFHDIKTYSTLEQALNEYRQSSIY